MPNNTLAEYLRKKRLELGLKQSEVGEKVGLSTATISKIERGDTIPSKDAVVKLAKALSLDEDTVLLLAGYQNKKLENLTKLLEEQINLYHKRMKEFAEYVTTSTFDDYVFNWLVSHYGKIVGEEVLKGLSKEVDIYCKFRLKLLIGEGGNE